MRLGATKTGASTTYNGLGDQLYDKGGASPTLDLNFASNGSLVDSVTGKTLVTHTRASDATYVDGDGIIKDAVTNLIPYSEDFAGNWGTAAATVVNDAGAAPFGTALADKVVSAGGGVFKTNIAVENGKQYTYSVYLKYVEGVNLNSIGFERFGTTNINARATVDLRDGTISNNGAADSVAIENVGNGWYRISVVATATDTTAVIINYAVAGNEWLIWALK